MNRPSVWMTAAALAAMGLSACASGGGGGGSLADGAPPLAPGPPAPPAQPPATATAFTSWSAVAAPYRVTLSGVGLDVPTSNITNAAVSTTRFGPPTASTPSFTLAALGDGTLQGLQFASGSTLIDLQAGIAGATLFCCAQLLDNTKTPVVAGATASGSDYDNRHVVYSPPADLGWNYQTFGAWSWANPAASGGPRDGFAGGFSVGAATPAGAIPTSGVAVFAGKVLAWTTVNGFAEDAASAMQLSVDFGARSAVFNSGDLRNDFGIVGTAMSGVLTYSSGQNALSGTLTTSNGRFTGPVTGQFYGPAAQEVGGAFALSPTSGLGDESIVGGFGAKR